eukprot:765581-Hanusia_phi.AAC.1
MREGGREKGYGTRGKSEKREEVIGDGIERGKGQEVDTMLRRLSEGFMLVYGSHSYRSEDKQSRPPLPPIDPNLFSFSHLTSPPLFSSLLRSCLNPLLLFFSPLLPSLLSLSISHLLLSFMEVHLGTSIFKEKLLSWKARADQIRPQLSSTSRTARDEQLQASSIYEWAGKRGGGGGGREGEREEEEKEGATYAVMDTRVVMSLQTRNLRLAGEVLQGTDVFPALSCIFLSSISIPSAPSSSPPPSFLA